VPAVNLLRGRGKLKKLACRIGNNTTKLSGVMRAGPHQQKGQIHEGGEGEDVLFTGIEDREKLGTQRGREWVQALSSEDRSRKEKLLKSAECLSGRGGD